ncbi:MAG: serine/threonine-protein phosphatase [Phycisphaerae bacterium]|nr:serine/threonine-protein phosphatase [Phycisphaerae bacterium]
MAGPDADLLRRLDEERARVLRRRVAWYCRVLLALLSLSLMGDTLSLVGGARDEAIVGFLYDLPLVALFLGAFIYVDVARPDRRRLLLALSVLTVAGTGFAMAMEPIGDQLSLASAESPPHASAWRPGVAALVPFAALHTIASILVPMRLRESARIVGPCWATFAVVVAGLQRVPVGPAVILIASFPLAAAPGVLWSAWRYREFDERFRWRDLGRHHRALAAELDDARRIHEALFPPEITRGPVRLAYRYEPMRQIGGDFLFAHPLAIPASEPAASLSIVLIDVSGHGVPAALAVNRLHGELRRVFGARPDAGPGEVLAALNAYAFADLAPQGMYATAMCVRIDPATRVARWAGAGHPPGLLLSPHGSLTRLPSGATMLGVVEPERFDPDERSTGMGTGHGVVLFTDGAIEAADPSGTRLGLERVIQAARSAPPGARAGSVASAAASHRAGNPEDDLLAVEAWLPD